MNKDITIETHNNILVLRDDLLPGGTKSILMDEIMDRSYSEYVYASPVYGAFQIALSIWCKNNDKKCTIFCAERKNKHQNTIECIENGATVVEVPYGYLNVVNKRARDYCDETGALKLKWGSNDEVSKDIIVDRMRSIIEEIGYEPDEIWCAIGSGTLVEGILKGTNNANIFGVIVGAEYKNSDSRLNIIKYDKSFDKVSKYKAPFPSIGNYDLKAFEYCMKNYDSSKKILFWNVYG